MIRIAVCDDEENTARLHQDKIREILSENRTVYETALYTRSDNLLSDITEDGFFYDILLLDIEMPGIGGMEIAEKIRPYLPDVKIIFITSHIEYAIDAYELSVFRYVPKNDLDRRLPTAILDAVKLLELEADRAYTIRTNSRLERIPYKSIYYIERDGKNAAIVTAAGVSKVRRTLAQIHEELDAEEFIYIDRGCIVNLIYIAQVKGNTAVLKDGSVLPVSRSHLQSVKEEINRYWGSHI